VNLLLVASSFACRSTRVGGEADLSTDGHFCRGRPSKLVLSRNRYAACTSPHPMSKQLPSPTLLCHPPLCRFQLLHPDLKFDPSLNPPSYTSQDQVSPLKLVFLPHSPFLTSQPTGY
jgi:hypothetical protein